MGYMSRDSRKVIDELQKVSGNEHQIQDVMDAEQLIFTYYAKTICGHIGRFFNPDSKGNPERVAFYVKPTRSINKGKRTTDTWEMTESDKEIYLAITCGFVIEDFSYDQLKIIKEMCKYDIKDIKSGIAESKKENIYSIIYLQRIVEGIVAKREHMRSQRQKIKELYKYDDNSDIINRSPLELASMKYSWKNTLENSVLEKKVKELYDEQ